MTSTYRFDDLHNALELGQIDRAHVIALALIAKGIADIHTMLEEIEGHLETFYEVVGAERP